jgi:hypothetical protein
MDWHKLEGVKVLEMVIWSLIYSSGVIWVILGSDLKFERWAWSMLKMSEWCLEEVNGEEERILMVACSHRRGKGGMWTFIVTGKLHWRTSQCPSIFTSGRSQPVWRYPLYCGVWITPYWLFTMASMPKQQGHGMPPTPCICKIKTKEMQMRKSCAYGNGNGQSARGQRYQRALRCDI